MSSYERTLREISELIPGVSPNSPEERAAIDRFTDFFSDFSEEKIREKARDFYADDVYFNDTLKEVRGIDALEAYLTESASAVESCHAEVQDVAVSRGNYYFRWVMDIQFKRFKKGQVTRTIGMSHIRFDEQGKVVLHQDYWDSTSGLFIHLPVIGYLIRKIKARL
jgi:limonene-1,2-epoxide hydrolase